MLHGGQCEASVPGHCGPPPVPLPAAPVVPPVPAPPLPVVMRTHLPLVRAYASLQRTAHAPFSQMATPLVGGAGHSQVGPPHPVSGCCGTHIAENGQHFSPAAQVSGLQLPASAVTAPPIA